MNHQRKITKEEINDLPSLKWDGEIIEVVTLEGALRALSLLAKETELGFDTETRPAFTKGESYDPALLQLATRERAFIFRLHFFELPAEMGEILADPDIKKIGVAPRDDIKGMQKILNFEPGGFIDLSLEARKRGVPEEGLRPLCALYLGRRLLKGATRTNWANRELTESQIRYAALDAVVGLLIFDEMRKLD